MKNLLKILVVAALALTGFSVSPMPCHDCGQAFAGPTGFAGQPFSAVRYYAHGGKGSGLSASSPKDIALSDTALALPLGTLVTNVYVIVDTALTGTTALNVGDDDSSNGYVPTAAVTLGSPGMYGWDAKSGGSYKRIQTAGATDAGDIYVVPNAKYYAAAGKSVKVATSTANTAGAFRVVVEGWNFGR